jgi:proteic killer suppression protein
MLRVRGDKHTAAIFAGYAIRDLPPHTQRRARAKLLAIDAAKQLDDLRVPPGNRLEVLHGDREGQRSIRINDQWRICFDKHPARPGRIIVPRHRTLSLGVARAIAKVAGWQG